MNVTIPVSSIRAIGRYEGEEVQIKGWLANSRSSGAIHFLTIRDGTGFLQGVVVKNEVSQEVFSIAGSLTQESSIMVQGRVRADKRAPGGYELTIKNIILVHQSIDYPITPKEHGVDYLMDNRHLWLRSTRQHAIMRIRHEIIKAIRDYLDEEGFILVDAPILTPSACEGTTTLFETNYFEEKAYLTQSGQLYNEACAMALGRVYCFGPTFRAEKSKTRRHLMEFWMVEPEMAYCDLEENLRIQEGLVCFIVKQILERCTQELVAIKRNIPPLENVKPPFPRITYDKALELLKKKGLTVEWGGDFGGTDETVLSQEFDRPFFVTHFPAKCKAFYMKPDPARPEVVLCADMLAPEGHGEIIGGSQREDDLAALETRMRDHNMPIEPYQWYLDLRRYGSVPHGGFGLGIERTVTWICGLEHVRETIPFPRMLSRMYP